MDARTIYIAIIKAISSIAAYAGLVVGQVWLYGISLYVAFVLPYMVIYNSSYYMRDLFHGLTRPVKKFIKFIKDMDRTTSQKCEESHR